MHIHTYVRNKTVSSSSICVKTVDNLRQILNMHTQNNVCIHEYMFIYLSVCLFN